MITYNASFFGLFENMFILLKQEFGEEKALNLFTNLMEKGLRKSYGTNFVKGDLAEFERLVGDRDLLVGLRVEFIRKSDKEMIYKFYDDPFPNLREQVDQKKLDKCYMAFKVNHILGDSWTYKTSKHLWQGDDCTEYLIYKIN